MQKLRSCLAIGAALCLSGVAHAVTITFNSLHHTGQVAWVNDPLVTDGFTFTNNCGIQNRCFNTIGTSFPNPRYNIDFAGAAVSANYTATTTSLAPTAGGAFNLQSIDLADLTNQGYTPGPGGSAGSAVQMLFTFQYADGRITTQGFALDNVVGAQTVLLNQTGLTKFSFATVSDVESYQFDNVVVTTAPVPEPASLALMLGGVAALGAAVRKRKQA